LLKSAQCLSASNCRRLLVWLLFAIYFDKTEKAMVVEAVRIFLLELRLFDESVVVLEKVVF